ncbi:hypothetical protein CBR_g48777 [Chara braunii]|uniref:Sec39 domain-containing protein n=1 Tax=Chara braunii TaxID=69332 RepID=A0A388M399_CHABU|nr:hypothetical protein CBR_g48777 [Chara braunii]|eukprot:GBG89067.1 hypothetical protein CBR_g48777 [Chara braunii]
MASANPQVAGGAGSSEEEGEERNVILYEKFKLVECRMQDGNENEDGGGSSEAGSESGTSGGGVVGGVGSKVWQLMPGPRGVSAPVPGKGVGKAIAISPCGQYVAVLYGNGVWIFNKSGEFKKPCGSFKGDYISELERTGLEGAAGKGGYELLVLGQDKMLYRLPIVPAGSPTSGPAPVAYPKLQLGKQHPSGVMCMTFLPARSLLVVVGPGASTPDAAASAGGGQQCALSVSFWTLTDSSPFSTVISHTPVPRSWRAPGLGQSWLRLGAGGRPANETSCTPKAVFSPNGKTVACVDQQGNLHLLEMKMEIDTKPSVAFIKLGKSPSPVAQGSSDKDTEVGKSGSWDVKDVDDIGWWSDQALIIAGTSGILSVSTVPDLVNILGKTREVFQPHLCVTQGVRGRIFVLDDIKKEEEATATGGKTDDVCSRKEAKEGPDKNDKGNADKEDEEKDEEEEEEEDDELQGGRMSGLSKWIPWGGREKADAGNDSKSDMTTQGWRLVSLVEQTPSQMLRIHLAAGEFESALKLARKFDLDAGDVYKARWLKSDGGKDSIHDNLPKIKDRDWVLKECLRRVSSNAGSTMALLQYGLLETEKFRVWEEEGESDETRENVSESSGDEVPRKWWYRRQRLRLLQYRDRMETFLAVNLNRYVSEEYLKFRACDLPKAAVQFAQHGMISTLEHLFKRHALTLSPSILKILDNLPETLPPYTYRAILPAVNPDVPGPLRPVDWVEKAEILEKLTQMGLLEDADEGAKAVGIDVCTEEMVRITKGVVWPPKETTEDWYRARARKIDEMSGQLEHSLSLLDLGIQRGFEGLVPFLEMLSDLHGVVYGASAEETGEGGGMELSLSMWEDMGNYEKFCIIMRGVNAKNAVERLRERGFAFLKRVGRTEAGPESDALEVKSDTPAWKNSMLGQWLVERAHEGKIDLCALVLEELESSKEVERGAFLSEKEFGEVVLDCVYGCPTLGDWQWMSAILQQVPRRKTMKQKGNGKGEDRVAPVLGRLLRRGVLMRRGGEEEVQGAPEVPGEFEAGPLLGEVEEGSGTKDWEVALHERIERAEGHVEAGRLLALYEVPKQVSFFLVCHEEESEVKQLLRKLISSRANLQPPLPDSEWASLWVNIRTLHERAFPFVNQESLLLEFCRGMLRAGKFSLAKNYVRGTSATSLPLGDAEKLIIDISHEYFRNSSSMEDADVAKARQCLQLLSQDSELVKSELDLINAVSIKLPEMGVKLLPYEVREVSDRMELVHLALATDPTAYQRMDEVKKLASLLGLKSAMDRLAVEAAVARQAASCGDVGTAQSVCMQLIMAGYSEIWDLCGALARGSGGAKLDLESARSMLGFSLCHCDEDSVADLMAAWKEMDLKEEYGVLRRAIGLHDNEPEGDGDCKVEDATADLWDRGRVALSTLGICVDGNRMPDDKPVPRSVAKFATNELLWLMDIRKTCGGSEERVDVGMEALAMAAHWLVNLEASVDEAILVEVGRRLIDMCGGRVWDELGLSYLLAVEPREGVVSVLEEQVESRTDYDNLHRLLLMILYYCSVQAQVARVDNAKEVRSILSCSATQLAERVVHAAEDVGLSDSEGIDWLPKVKATLGKLRAIKDALSLQDLIPDIAVGRFATGDTEYISGQILSLVAGPLTGDTGVVLARALNFAETYGVDKWEVLMSHAETLLLSDWPVERVEAMLANSLEGVLTRPVEVVKRLQCRVYPQLSGSHHSLLQCYYSLIESCYTAVKNGVEGSGEALPSGSAVLETGESLEDCLANAQRLIMVCAKVKESIPALDLKKLVVAAGADHVAPAREAVEEIRKHVSLDNVDCLAEVVEDLAAVVRGQEERVEPSGRAGSSNGLPSSSAVFLAMVEKVLFEVGVDSEENVPEDQGLGWEDRYKACCCHLAKLAASDLVNVLRWVMKESRRDMEPEGEERTVKFWACVADDGRNIFWNKKEEMGEEGKQIAASFTEAAVFLKVVSEMLQSQMLTRKQAQGVMDAIPTIGSGGEADRVLRGMVVSGCSLETVIRVMRALESAQAGEEGGRSWNVMSLYLESLDGSLKRGRQLEGMLGGGIGGDSLSGMGVVQGVLVSLAEQQQTEWLEVEERDRIRLGIWERLRSFADDFTAPMRMRIQVLELLESLSSPQESGKGGFSPDLAKVDRSLGGLWGEWKPPGTLSEGGLGGLSEQGSSLLLLRSMDVVSSLWEGVEIRLTDLRSNDAAELLFLRLLECQKTPDHLRALGSLLEIWGEVFDEKSDYGTEQKEGAEEETKLEAEEAGDEGWETIEEHETDIIPVYALHRCWCVLLEEMSQRNCSHYALQLLDRANARGWSLLARLTESGVDPFTAQQRRKVPIGLEEAEALLERVCAGEGGIVLAAKMGLLLPYARIHELVLKKLLMVIEKGREREREEWERVPKRGIRRASSGEESPEGEGEKHCPEVVIDSDLVVLILLSGMLVPIAGDPSRAELFQMFCNELAPLAWQLRSLLGSAPWKQGNKVATSLRGLLCTVAFPMTVMELTAGRLHGLAGALVLQFLRVHPSLMTMDGAFEALKRFLSNLQGWLDIGSMSVGVEFGDDSHSTEQLSNLKGTLEHLAKMFAERRKVALETLINDMK